MAEVASAFVTLIPSFKGGAAAIAKELDGPSERAGRTAGGKARKGFAAQFGNKSVIPTAAIAAGVAGLGMFTKAAIDAAGNAEQSLGATETIFGKWSKSVIASSNAAATKYGLDANAYRESANLIGSQLKNQGVAAKDLAGSTDALIGKGADLASMFGGTTQDAVNALSSAFKGEMDPIERYGISLSQTKVNALLAARGQDKLKGSAATLAKQQAITDLIMQQSKDSVGNFARESDTLQGKQQRLQASFSNVKTTLGSMLLPAMTDLFDVIGGKVLPKVEGFVKGMQDGTGAGGKFADGVKRVGDMFGTAAAFVGKYQNVIVPVLAAVAGGVATFKVLVGVVRAYTAVQTALNVVLTANPIGLVVVAIGALVAGLVVAYKKSETFRDIVNGAWDTVKMGALQLATVAVRAFRGMVNMYLTVVSTLVTGAAKAFGWVPGLGPKLKTAADKIAGFKDSANAALSKVERDLQISADTAKAQRSVNALRRQAGKPVTMEVFLKTKYTAGRVNVEGVGSVNVGQRAAGGPVKAGKPYVVGERRPELFVPETNGYIVPRVPSNDDGSKGSSAAPLVGSLTIQSTGNTKDDLDEALWTLRRIRRGGVYA